MLELAVGVILAVAFGAVVTAFTDGVLMPPIGMALGGVDFDELAVVLKEATLSADGTVVEPVLLKWGHFVQKIIDFLIIAFVIFLVVRAYNNFLRKREAEPDPIPPAPTKEESLLMEIRDLLARGH